MFNTLMYKCGENEPHFLDPDLRGKVFSLSLSGIMLVVILYRESFIKLRKFLSIAIFLRVFVKNEC